VSTGLDATGQAAGGGIGKAMRGTPSWAVSVGIHMIILMAAMTIPMGKAVRDVATDLFSGMDSSADDGLDTTSMEDLVGTKIEDGVQLSNTASALGAGGTIGTGAPGIGEHQVSGLESGIESGASAADGVEVALGGDNVGLMMENSKITETLKTGGGAAVESPEGGTGGSIDRLVQELQASLRNRRTVALWLFDASLSLKTRRNLIADRFENVYRQLDALDASKTTGVSTVVASFGKDYNLITKDPVLDIRTVVPKVRAIKDDVSGKEMVFTAVKNLAMTFHRYKNQNGGQNLMMFIVTDEKGDDVQLLEESIMLCRKYGIRVFVVGNASMLGREDGYVHWKYDDGVEEDIRVDAGPETYEPDMVTLGFFGVADTKLTRLSAGYGPYALTRLCKETGGMFFISEESAAAKKFPSAVMRNYTPDYRPVKKYEADLKKSMCKQSLVEAAKISRKNENVAMPPLVFRADTDNVLKEQIAEAQKPAAVVSYGVEALLSILSKGEKDRPNVKEARWRASYDLAIGRSLAMKARFLGYNKMLAEMRGTPKVFKTKTSDQWKLEPSKEIESGADVKKIEKQAQMYLKRCADEHPDTPWGMLALQELSTPMGWQWKEATANYQKMDRDQAEAKRKAQFADEATKKKMQEKAAPPRAKPVL